jgi:molybdopterin-containing oxidoreductase family membrane subunit
LYARTFPVVAQAEIKSILKSSGDNYKRDTETLSELVKEKRETDIN